MAEEVQWLDGYANVTRNVEKICPGRHISQNQWQPEWDKAYQSREYDYISDYECIFDYPVDVAGNIVSYQDRWNTLQALKQRGTNVPITNLAHFTTPANAEMIIENGGFRGGKKKINEDEEGSDISAKFSWWSPIFTEDDKNLVRGTLGAAIQPFLDEQYDVDYLVSQFATSDAFRPRKRRYGGSYFQYGINELCQHYKDNIQGQGLQDTVQYKILGTFGYKQEVMHAVLVCSQANGTGRQFGAYPPVLTPVQDVNNEAVVTRDISGNWFWKPQATVSVISRLHDQQSRPDYCRWEHVAFAFHIPDEWENEKLMAVADLRNNLHEL